MTLSQSMTGLVVLFFCLAVKAEQTPEEKTRDEQRGYTQQDVSKLTAGKSAGDLTSANSQAFNQTKDVMKDLEEDIKTQTASGNLYQGTNYRTTPNANTTLTGADISKQTQNYTSVAQDTMSADAVNQKDRGGSDAAGQAMGLLMGAVSMGVGIADMRNKMGNQHTTKGGEDVADSGEKSNSGDEPGALAAMGKAISEYGMASLEFGLGALSMAQAGIQMASAGKNADKSREYRTKDDVYNPYGGTTTPTTTDDKPGNTGNNSGGDGTTNDMTQAKLEAALPGVGPQLIESFKEKGYVFDFKNGTLVTPNGTKLSGNDFNDPSKLDSAFGVSPGSVQAALAKEHEAMSKGGDGTGTGTGTAAGGLNAGLKGSSGFGGSAYLATSGALGNGILQGDSYGDMGDGYSSLGSSKKLKNGEANLNGLRNPAFDDKIGTLTKIYNGDKIGAESENIFMMLHKQYNTQKTQDKFLSNK